MESRQVTTMKPDRPRRPLPLVPRLVLGGLAILLLSWLFFMTQYLVKVSRQPRGEAPPHRATVVNPTNAP